MPPHEGIAEAKIEKEKQKRDGHEKKGIDAERGGRYISGNDRNQGQANEAVDNATDTVGERMLRECPDILNHSRSSIPILDTSHTIFEQLFLPREPAQPNFFPRFPFALYTLDER